MSQFFDNVDLKENQFSFSFLVKYLIYQNPDNNFFAAVSKPELSESYNLHLSGATCVVTGYSPCVNPGELYDAVGQWINTERGWQLSAELIQQQIPDNKEGIKKFLLKYCKGVGRATINKLVDNYGLATIDKIKENDENLTCIKGISKKKAYIIRNAVLTHEEVEQLSLFFMKYGMSDYKKIFELYEELKPNVYEQIMTNPYCICEVLGIKAFYIADRIAIDTKIVNGCTRLEYGIMYYINHSLSTYGHVFIPKKMILENINDYVCLNGFIKQIYTEEQIEIALSKLKDDGFISVEKDEFYEECIYLSSYNVTENRIIECIDTILNYKGFKKYGFNDVSRFLNKFENNNNLILDELQKDAVHYSNENNIVIITGGPGVGKTLTLNIIIEFFKEMDNNIDIKLSAPTGRAAKRMSEMTSIEAFTIHRLLGINSDNEESVNFDNEFDADILIIDEFSMVDIFLFYKVLKIVAAKRIKLIICGDYNQLPSVGPGLVLKDLVESNVIPTITLTKIFRQSQQSQIVSNSYKMLKGLPLKNLEFDKRKKDFYFMRASTPERILDNIVKSINTLTNRFSFNDIMVLTPMLKGPLGSININKVVQDAVNPTTGNSKAVTSDRFTFKINDRVIQVKNNYQLSVTGYDGTQTLGVFNGDIGYIKDIYEDDGEFIIRVDYDMGYVEYTPENIDELSLAYSITIHKAQGSEFPCVIIPSSPILLNTDKNLLYTGVTRAKDMVEFIGSISFFDIAISRNLSINRYTIMKKKLTERMSNKNYDKAVV